MAENFDQIWSLCTSTHGILFENFWTVGDFQSSLRFCQSSIDATCCFGAIATKKWILVNHTHVDTMFQNGVCCRQTTQTTTHNNDLFHLHNSIKTRTQIKLE